MSNASLYERDFYGWAMAQAALLRVGGTSEADLRDLPRDMFPWSCPFTAAQIGNADFWPEP